MKKIRSTIKAVLPVSVRKIGRKAEAYALRLRYWRAVGREIKGETGADQTILDRAVRSALVDSARGLSKWRDPVLPQDAAVKVIGAGRFKVRGKSDDLFHVLPSREPEVLTAIRANLGPGDVFVDAGANIGFYSIVAANIVGPTGHVIAIEMMPDTAAILREHIRMNGLGNVTIVEKAVSDTGGGIVTAFVADGRFGQASISTDLATHGKRRVEVPTATLDEILTAYPSIRLMKMDLEGVEDVALAGGREALMRISAVIFEDWSGGEVERLWPSSTYSVRKLDPRNSIAERRSV